jgi:CheY-like chemotaxis protein
MSQNSDMGRDTLPSILLVDDDEVLRERLAQAIRARGYEVKTAGSASEALKEVAVESPEMAVLDLKMPGMSGLELLRELRQQDPATRVLMLTGPSRPTPTRSSPRSWARTPPRPSPGPRPRPWPAPSGSTSSGCSTTAATTSPRRRAGWASTGGRCSASCTSTRPRGEPRPGAGRPLRAP